MNENKVSGALIFLGLSIITGAWLVSGSLIEEPQTVESFNGELPAENVENQLMTKSELGEYLGLDADELARLLPEKKDNLTTSKLPYIEIDNTYYFPVKAIDKWLTEVEVYTFR